jgi:hypothetical protein
VKYESVVNAMNESLPIDGLQGDIILRKSFQYEDASDRQLDQVEELCVFLFDAWCEQRSVLPLAYLMYAWPIVERTPASTERLISALTELVAFHPDEITWWEGDLIRKIFSIVRVPSLLSGDSGDSANRRRGDAMLSENLFDVPSETCL